MSACVQGQILKLADAYRSVIWLFDIQDFSMKETAAIARGNIDRPRCLLGVLKTDPKSIRKKPQIGTAI